MEVKYKVNINKTKIIFILILLPFLISFSFLLILVWHNKYAVILDILCLCIWVLVFLCILFSGIKLYGDRIVAKAFVFEKTIILDDIGSIELVSDEQDSGKQKVHVDGMLAFYSKNGSMIYYFPLRIIGDDVKDFVDKIVEVKTSITV